MSISECFTISFLFFCLEAKTKAETYINKTIAKRKLVPTENTRASLDLGKDNTEYTEQIERWISKRFNEYSNQVFNGLEF